MRFEFCARGDSMQFWKCFSNVEFFSQKGFYAFREHEKNFTRYGWIDRVSKKEENLVKCVDLRLEAWLKAYFVFRKWMLIEWYQLSTKGFKRDSKNRDSNGKRTMECEQKKRSEWVAEWMRKKSGRKGCEENVLSLSPFWTSNKVV